MHVLAWEGHTVHVSEEQVKLKVTYEALCCGGRLLPPLKFLVYNLEVLQHTKICREVVHLLAGRGIFVCNCNLDDRKGI